MLLLSRLSCKDNVTKTFFRRSGDEKKWGREVIGTGSVTISLKIAKERDGFNDTKYKIVLTLDRLKAP